MKSSPENAHDPSFDVRCLLRRFHSEIVLTRNVQFSPGYLGVRGSLYPEPCKSTRVIPLSCLMRVQKGNGG